MRRLVEQPSEKAKIAMVLRTIHPDIRKYVRVNECKNLEELVERLETVESNLYIDRVLNKEPASAEENSE